MEFRQPPAGDKIYVRKDNTWFLRKRGEHTNQSVRRKMHELKQHTDWFKDHLNKPEVIVAGYGHGYTKEEYKQVVELSNTKESDILNGYSRFGFSSKTDYIGASNESDEYKS